MKEQFFVEVYGRNDGKNTVPVEGTVKVGDGLAIFVGPEKDELGLLSKLRCVVAAMRLSNELGLSQYNIGKVVSEAASDRSDLDSIRAVINACKHHKPNSSDQSLLRFAAFFSTQARSEGMSTHLAQDERASSHTCSPDDSSRQEDQDAE